VQTSKKFATQLQDHPYVGSVDVASEVEELAQLAWQDRGYFSVQVQGDAKILTSSPINQRIAVGLHINEGPRYRLARTIFQNNRAIANTQALRNLFPIKDGEIFRREAVAKGLEDVRRVYGEYGYVNAALTPNFQVHEATQTISLDVDFHQGWQFYITQIRAVGLDDVTSANLLCDFRLQRGSAYNQRLAEFFFRLPAGVSAFSRIHLDIDEREGTVAITFDARRCVDFSAVSRRPFQ
jgi:outer membrane protein insertion porin family